MSHMETQNVCVCIALATHLNQNFTIFWFHWLAWPGLGWTGLEWSGLDWPGLAWPGLAWTVLAWTGLTWTGLAWTGLAWTGLAWTGLAWPGLSRVVPNRLSSTRKRRFAQPLCDSLCLKF